MNKGYVEFGIKRDWRFVSRAKRGDKLEELGVGLEELREGRPNRKWRRQGQI